MSDSPLKDYIESGKWQERLDRHFDKPTDTTNALRAMTPLQRQMLRNAAHEADQRSREPGDYQHQLSLLLAALATAQPEAKPEGVETGPHMMPAYWPDGRVPSVSREPSPYWPTRPPEDTER